MDLIRSIILGLLNFYAFAIIVYVLMSWIPQKGEGMVEDLRTALGTICEPYLGLFRKLIPPIGGMVDITPIFAILVLELIKYLVIGIL